MTISDICKNPQTHLTNIYIKYHLLCSHFRAISIVLFYSYIHRKELQVFSPFSPFFILDAFWYIFLNNIDYCSCICFLIKSIIYLEYETQNLLACSQLSLYSRYWLIIKYTSVCLRNQHVSEILLQNHFPFYYLATTWSPTYCKWL